MYVKEASKIMGQREILNQLSQSWKNLNKEINKCEKKFSLKK